MPLSGEQKLSSQEITSLDGADNSTMPGGVVLRRLHVSSILLASDSRFFKAMLSNGMMESQSKEIQLEV